VTDYDDERQVVDPDADDPLDEEPEPESPAMETAIEPQDAIRQRLRRRSRRGRALADRAAQP
jgi:hypothetical protein